VFQFLSGGSIESFSNALENSLKKTIDEVQQELEAMRKKPAAPQQSKAKGPGRGRRKTGPETASTGKDIVPSQPLALRKNELE
jgi:hypothetical protein